MSAREYVEAIAKLRNFSLSKGERSRPLGARYDSVEELVLAVGHEWTLAPDMSADRKYKLGTPRECFRNAFKLAEESRGRLTYVEGFATYHIPVHHAWCAGADGRVVDNTWRPWPDARSKVEWSTRTYFGVPFDLTYLRRLQLKHKVFGVFYVARDVMFDDPREFVPARWSTYIDKLGVKIS